MRHIELHDKGLISLYQNSREFYYSDVVQERATASLSHRISFKKFSSSVGKIKLMRWLLEKVGKLPAELQYGPLRASVADREEIDPQVDENAHAFISAKPLELMKLAYNDLLELTVLSALNVGPKMRMQGIASNLLPMVEILDAKNRLHIDKLRLARVHIKTLPKFDLEEQVIMTDRVVEMGFKLKNLRRKVSPSSFRMLRISYMGKR